MRTRSGITFQQSYELRNFLSRLSSGEVTTPEVAHALIILREFNPGEPLIEWCNGVAHKKRDRGDTALVGVNLLEERLHIDQFFAQSGPINKIPRLVFEAFISFLQEDDFGSGSVALKRIFPHGYHIDEIVAWLRFSYRLDKKAEFFRLVRTRDDLDSLRKLSALFPLVRDQLWGFTPCHFNAVFDKVREGFLRLIGKAGDDILLRRKDLFTLHFLCCFHLTEVHSAKRQRHPCYLALDETSSERLALNLAIYERENRKWEQMELSYEDRGASLSGSHSFSRPYLVTDLEVARFLVGPMHDRPDSATYLNALVVGKTSDGMKLVRVRPNSRILTFVDHDPCVRKRRARKEG